MESLEPRVERSSAVEHQAPTLLPDLLRARAAEVPLWRRAAYFAGSGVCFALGVIFWVVPLVTGIPFYVVGLVLLAVASRRCRLWVNAFDRKLPRKARLAVRRALHKFPVRAVREMAVPFEG
ncbi:MAG: hypothetical protein HY721_14915 [Planctomycetes bacterium]|nr:hypothetical protein [Planctomycetota bacterium]